LQFIQQNLWMFLVGVAIFVAAVVGVIWGIVAKGRWTDRGWMLTKDGKPIRWRPGVLLTVWYRKDLAAVYVDELFAATRYFNDAIGRTVFDSVAKAPEAFRFDQLPPAGSSLVSVFDDDGAEPNHGQTTFTNTPEGEMERARVQLPEAQIHLARKLIRHEFGHVLGLDHDEQRGSIMYPSIQGRPQALGTGDIKRLREYYG
jgi:hypothetical protein